jgi:hypothetical protein
MKRTALSLLFSLAAGGLVAAQDFGGNYIVEGTNFDGSPYRGTAQIVVTTENTCRIVWNTGSTSEGICMRYGPAFSAAYSSGDVVGLVIYEVMADGSLNGIWTIADQPGVGTEILRRAK